MTSETLLSQTMVCEFSAFFFFKFCTGATILRQLEVEHPAAKVIIELSQLQDKEVGDGTTSVVIIAAELLKVNSFAESFLLNL